MGYTTGSIQLYSSSSILRVRSAIIRARAAETPVLEIVPEMYRSVDRFDAADATGRLGGDGESSLDVGDEGFW